MAGSDTVNQREKMVASQIEGRGIYDAALLAAFRQVPREAFVTEKYKDFAYDDGPLPILENQTISQPYIVALMTEALRTQPALRVLEVGTGSGYQAAVLASCGCRVYTVERVPELHESAAHVLRDTGFSEVRLRLGDGSLGWPEEAPFDRIIVTAAAAAVPPALRDQLVEEGVLVAPIGDDWLQVVRRYRKQGEEFEAEDLEGARFVPLIQDQEDGTTT